MVVTSHEKRHLFYEGTPLSGVDAVVCRRPLYYDPTPGRLTTLDSFDGKLEAPQSLHKYLYCNADSVNFTDPSGCFSMGSMLSGLAIGSFLAGTLGGMAVGVLNAGVGLATGQMDWQSAVNTYSRFTLLGAGAGAGAAIFFLQFKLLGAGAGATLFASEVAGGGIALWQSGGPNGLGQGLIHAYYQNPKQTIRAYKNDINTAAAAYGVPPDLVAAVLLAELNDYDVYDLLGDDWTLWGAEAHSIGIAQLRIDNVRNWNLSLPEFGGPAAGAPAKAIRAALEEDQRAILLLAQAIRFFGNNGPVENHPSLGLTAGQPVNFATWGALPQDTRAKIARLFGGAKDDLQGRLTSSRALLQADVTYLQVINEGLLQ